MKNIKEDTALGGVPANNVGTGHIAGAPPDSPVVRKPTKIIRRKKIGVHEVFEVDSDYFHRCRIGKRSAQHYKTFVGDDDLGKEIKEYAYANPGAAIIVEDEKTGAMCFLRYGKNGSFVKEN